MIIKLANILDVEKPLAELMEQPLPIRLSYKLAKLLRKASDEIRQFYSLREGLIKRLGVEQSDGSYIIDDEDKKLQFTDEIRGLAEVNVELIDFEPISISDFDKTDVKVTPVQMAALQEFFKD